MIRQLPAVAARFVLVYLLIVTVTCVDVVSAQVTADDIKDKKIPVSEVEYIAKDAKTPDAKNSDASTDSQADIPKQLTLDGGWKMPGGVMNISGGVGSVGGTIAQFASNSYGIKPGSAMINGSFDGKQFSGTIVLRSKDEDGNIHELATPLKMSLSADANTLSGQFENRRFNKTQKVWSDEKRMQSVSFTRVDPIDADTLAAIKEAMAKARSEGDEAEDDPSMADGAEDSQNEDGSENGPITITSINCVEELGYRNLQVNNRSGKDKDNIGHIWLRITGENLPVKAQSLNITIDDPGINFTGNHKPDPEDEKALQIQVNLSQAAAPGPKQITLNEAPGTWDYDFTDLSPKSIDFVRPVYVDVYNPASELYRGELFFVRVKFPMPVKFKSRKMELKVGQTKLMDLEITPFEGNKMIFHSKALVLPGDKAALAIFEDRKGTGIDTPKDAITLNTIEEGQKLVAIFPGSKKDASGTTQIKPYAIATVRGLPSNDWIQAVSKAESCWENSSSSAKSKMPKGYTFTNQIIFTTKRNAGEWFTNSRNLHMTVRDHAACLLIRDEGIKQLRAKIQQYNKGDGIPVPTVKNETTKQAHLAAIKKRNDAKRRFAAQMSSAADQNLNHPLMRLQVAGPKNAGNMQLQDAIKSSTLRNAYGDARSMDALNYAVIAIDNAQGVMLGNMNYSLNRLTALSDCDYEGLLRVCGFGFGSIGQLVKNKLLVPSNEPGVEAGRMVPDRAGYASIDRINTLYKALRADEAYARSDTEMAIFVATAPFIYISVAATAGSTAASIAGGALVASELAELGLMASDMYDYIQLRDEEVQFREGLVEVAGTEGLSEVESEASDKYWSAMIAGGAALGGTALGEVGGAILKRFGKSGFQALEEAVEQAAKKGTKSLSKAQRKLLEQADLLKHLGDQPTPELATNLIKGIRQAKEAAEQTAKQVDQVQVASAADTGVKNTTENLADTVKESAPTVRGGNLAETVSDSAPTVKGEDLIDTVKTPSPPKTGDDLTETMVLNNPPKSADDLTKTVSDSAPTVKGEDLIDTVKTPSPPKTGDDLTETMVLNNPPKSADDLTKTVVLNNPPKAADDLTKTVSDSAPTVKGEDLIDTVRTPSPPKTGDDLTKTVSDSAPTVRGDLTKTVSDSAPTVRGDLTKTVSDSAPTVRGDLTKTVSDSAPTVRGDLTKTVSDTAPTVRGDLTKTVSDSAPTVRGDLTKTVSDSAPTVRGDLTKTVSDSAPTVRGDLTKTVSDSAPTVRGDLTKTVSDSAPTVRGDLTKTVSDSAPTVRGDLTKTVSDSAPTVRGDLTKTVSDSAPTVRGGDLTETIKMPNPPKVGDDLTETMVLKNPPKSADDLTDTLRNTNPPKVGDDLTETMVLKNPPKSADDLTDTLRNTNPPKSADDLTDTLRNANPPKSADDLTDTLRNANPPKSADDLTDTLRNTNPPKTGADLTETVRIPAPPKPRDVEDLIGTVPPKANNADDLIKTAPPKPIDPQDAIGTQLIPPSRIPADDIGTRLPGQMPDVPAVKPDAPNVGSAADDVLPTPKPDVDLPQTGSALDVDIDDVVGLPVVAPPPTPGSKFTLPDGQQIVIGDQLGHGSFSDVFEYADKDGNIVKDKVIKFIRNGEAGKHGLNPWQLALEGKQVSELLEQADIPQLKVSKVDFDGTQPFMIVEKLDETMQTFDMKKFTPETRDAYRQAGKWSDAHDQAVVELYHNMAKKNLIWEDGHLENLFFKTGPDGKLIAGVLDHGRIGKWGELNTSLQNWVEGLEDLGHNAAKDGGGDILSNVGQKFGMYRFSSPEEFMAKMLEHKRWINWDAQAGKFVPHRMDPANIDRSLLDLEKYLPKAPTGVPGSSLPQPFMERWPWREVLKPAA